MAEEYVRYDWPSEAHYRERYREEIAAFKLKYGFEPTSLAVLFRSYLDAVEKGIPSLIEAEVERLREQRNKADEFAAKKKAEAEAEARALEEEKRRKRKERIRKWIEKLVEKAFIAPIKWVRKTYRTLEERTRP